MHTIRAFSRLALLFAIVGAIGLVPASTPPVQAEDGLQVGPGRDYATIQDAIDDAEDGDTICVYPGTYTDDFDCGSLDLSIVAQGINVIISRAQVTTDGTRSASFEIVGFEFEDDAHISGRNPYPLHHSVGRIEDCVFTRCEASSGGGAIEAWADCLILGCTFTDCKAGSTGGAVAGGFILDGCTFTRCVTTGSGRGGGAIGTGIVFPVLISDCEFPSCVATGDGGAVANTFLWNNADRGGAMALCDGGSRVQSNEFLSNLSFDHGGAIFNCEGLIQPNTFVGNTACGKGGAMRSVNDGSSKIRNNIFYENHSEIHSDPNLSNCNNPNCCLFNSWGGGGSHNQTGNLSCRVRSCRPKAHP